MITSFISVTHLQRQLKSVFSSTQPIHIVLNNNAVNGLVFSKEAAELFLKSGVLEQLREELWELQDKETRSLVRRQRRGKDKPVPFDTFAKKYGI